MLSPQIIANTVLKLSFSQKIPVTPMKLQKIMYFIYKDYLKATSKKLFSDSFECWQFGPVLSSIYYEFKSFGGNPITKFARDSLGNVSVVDIDNASNIAQSIKRIWDKYKSYSGSELSRLTHSDGSAWNKAKEKKCINLVDEDIRIEPEY